jgi:hypothetical protein
MTEHMKKPLGSPPLNDEFAETAPSTGTGLTASTQKLEPTRRLFIPAPPVPGRTSWCLSEK